LAQAPRGAELAESLREVLREVESAVSGGREAAAPAPPRNAAPEKPSGAAPKRLDVVVTDSAPLSATDALQALRELPAPILTQALETEQPRTIALVLDALNDGAAGEVYRRLPSEVRREVSLQFARQPAVHPEVMNRIVSALVAQARKLAAAPAPPDPTARTRKMADLLRQVDRDERLALLVALEASDAASAQAVKELLYEFEDLLRIENVSVQKLLGELDTKTLAQALKGADEAIREKVFRNLSKRAQETLQEEMDLSRTVPPAVGAQARKTVAEAIRRLDEKGDLVMSA
jgi:flagellar motor switch protein FliG